MDDLDTHRMPKQKKLVALLSDLMFTVKIQDAAKRAGLEAVFARSADEAIAAARQHPAVVIVDLNNTAVNALDVVQKLKGDEGTAKVPVVAYLSHVQVDLKRAAEENGCDLVVPRSFVSARLPELLARYAENGGAE